MRKHYLILFFLLLILAVPAFGKAMEPIDHSAKSILFEIIENGVISSKRASLEFSASSVDRKTWAECKFSILTINDDTKRIEIDAYYASTTESTIRSLQVDSDTVSFEMIPFSLAPDRPLKFIATRVNGTSNLYKASAVGLWSGLLDKNNLVTIEWRQVSMIKLPHTAIGK